MSRASTAERRETLLQAMQAVMAERGYEGATVAEVARRAGILGGLVHYHFEDKQALLLALLARLRGQAEARLDAALGGAEAGWPQLDAALDALLAVGSSADASAVACWVGIAAEAVRQPAVAEAYGAALEALHGKLGAAAAPLLPGKRSAKHMERTHRVAGALLCVVQGAFAVATTRRSLLTHGSAASAKAMARGLVAAEGGTP
jgi:TetR/AcrR family transcriptional repressor of bet genes